MCFPYWMCWGFTEYYFCCDTGAADEFRETGGSVKERAESTKRLITEAAEKNIHAEIANGCIIKNNVT